MLFRGSKTLYFIFVRAILLIKVKSSVSTFGKVVKVVDEK
ncbi:hypothetical protein CN425_12250 [Bacillus cereus]|uniref:Uncharacterized protein n=1 Tax=Bacillus cereus TaxID=1396 RepID=A0A2A8PWM8_BACCE|nr:hypothetical protein CON38_14605 [Bacillus cereus]PEW02218.1 hypothetical protein CN425_12250 [Bacillus cereus]PFI23534.1 hypothetical protein COI75_10885 [Bacillus cereus]